MKKRDLEKQQNQQHNTVVIARTAIVFMLTVFVLNLACYWIDQTELLHGLNILTANASGFLIKLAGMKAQLVDNVIRTPVAVWIVDTECTGVNLMILFASFLLAYPAPIKKKLYGILAGIPCLIAANIVRLFLMSVLGNLQPALLPYFHDYIWQVAFLLLIAWSWLVWIDMVNRCEVRKDIIA